MTGPPLSVDTSGMTVVPLGSAAGGYRRAMDARDALTMWVRDGLLPAELAEQLTVTLGEPEPVESRPDGNKLTRLLVFVGALLIGGGLLLFIGSQWGESSPSRRLLLLFGVYLVVVASAALAQRQRLNTTARAMWFLSSIAVGVNIFLIGQIYNLTLNYWQGTLLWMVACLAMGWAAPSTAQGWLAVPLGLLTLAWLSVPSTMFFEQASFVADAGGIRPLLPLLGVAMIAGAVLTPGTEFAWLRRPLQAFGAILVAVPLTISTFHPLVFAAVFEIDFRLLHVIVGAASLAAIAAPTITWKDRKSISNTAAKTSGWNVEMVNGTATRSAPNARSGCLGHELGCLLVERAAPAIVATPRAGSSGRIPPSTRKAACSKNIVNSTSRPSLSSPSGPASHPWALDGAAQPMARHATIHNRVPCQ